MPPKKKAGKGKKVKKGKKKKEGEVIGVAQMCNLCKARLSHSCESLATVMCLRQIYSLRPGLQNQLILYCVSAGDGTELSAEELYKRSLQEVGSLRERLGEN